MYREHDGSEECLYGMWNGCPGMRLFVTNRCMEKTCCNRVHLGWKGKKQWKKNTKYISFKFLRYL